VGSAPAAETEVAVIGAGVVGLACAAALARAGRPVVVLERREAVARETSSRNSGVVHAGLSYAPGSLKATLCARGRDLVWERCRAEGLPHRRTGKLVVAAAPEEAGALERLAANARANGVPGIEIVDGARAARLEPAVRGHAALLSPRSGVVDPLSLALSFAAEAEARGAAIALRTELIAIERAGQRHLLVARGGDGALARLACAAVVNAAGLGAERVAAAAGFEPAARGWRIRPCKGDWFALAPAAALRLARLVYPLPSPEGLLGIHASLDLGGRLRLGPDAEWVAEPRYDVDPAKADAFAAAASRLLPGVRADWLVPDGAGVRPRLSGPGEPARDFVIEEGSHDGRAGFVNLIGIESPGLTAAPAIAERVVELLAGL
jgi:L-2-hydroxyglutarate oxidase LhgO